MTVVHVVISCIESNSLSHCCLTVWLQLQLDPFRSVGILGFNSPEWLISNLAAIFAGYASFIFSTLIVFIGAVVSLKLSVS